MTSQTFAAGSAPRVIVTASQGRLTIETWDERSFAVEPAGAGSLADGALLVHEARADLLLRVPAQAAITVENHQGDLRIEALDASVRLRDIDGSAFIGGAATLLIERDELLRQRKARFRSRDVEANTIGVADIAEVHGSLRLTTAQRATVGDVGGSAAVRAVAGDLRLGNIGGSCEISQVGGALALENVGGSCKIGEVGGSVRAGHVGGSVELRATGPILGLGNVGGSARLELPKAADMTINAIVGGGISAPGTRGGPGMRTLVFGAGSTRLSLAVGGSLTLV